MDKKYKKEGFQIPEDYFEGLSERVLNRLKQEGAELSKDDGFSVPEGYFDGFEKKLQSRMEATKEPRVIKMKPWKKYYFVVKNLCIFKIN